MAEQGKVRGLEPGRRPALVISECQPATIDPAIAMFAGLADQAEARNIIGEINGLAAACRAVGAPVVHAIVRLTDVEHQPRRSALQAIMAKNPMLRRDSPHSAVDPRLELASSDLVSERSSGVTGFHASDLEALLKARGVDTILLAGVSTNIALLGMAIEAINRGFGVVLVEDCSAGATAETHAHAVAHVFPLLATVASREAVEAALGRL